jgi:hypothetical protein
MVELRRLARISASRILVGVICWICAVANAVGQFPGGNQGTFAEVQHLAEVAGAKAYPVTVTVDGLGLETFGISATGISSGILELTKRGLIVEIRVNDELALDSKLGELLGTEGIRSIVLECDASKFFDRVASLDVRNTRVINIELLRLTSLCDLDRVWKHFPKVCSLGLKLGELPCENLARSLVELKHLETLTLDSKTLSDETARDLIKIRCINILKFHQTNLKPSVLNGFAVPPTVVSIVLPSGTFLPSTYQHGCGRAAIAAAQFPEDIQDTFTEIQQLAELAGAKAYRVTEDVVLDTWPKENYGISATSITSRVLDLAKRNDVVELRVNEEQLAHNDVEVTALLSAEGIRSIVVECEAPKFFHRVAKLNVSNNPISMELLRLSSLGDLESLSRLYPNLRRLDLKLGELPCEDIGRRLAELEHLEVLKVDSKTLGDEASWDLLRMRSIRKLDFLHTNLEPGVLDGNDLGPMLRWIRVSSGTFVPIGTKRGRG